MNNQAKIKLEKIKKLKLPEKVRATADKIEKGLSSADAATQKKAEDALNKLYDQIKAVAAKQREEKTEKEVNEKTIVPQNADIAAPEAKKELTKKTTVADDVIDKALKNDPELSGFGKSDKRRDAGRKALPAGRRVAQKGWANQFGKSDGGRVYYENRENRKDRKSPAYKAGYPFLAKGGKIHPMDEEDGMFYVNLYKTKGDQIISVDEREYNSKASAMTYAMMKRDFMKVGESIFVMNDDGDVLYTSIGTKKMAMGGKFPYQNAQVGDNARVILDNKMGTIMVTYGRRFHLKFPDGSEKTYSAEELEFFPTDEMMAKGGYVEKFYDKKSDVPFLFKKDEKIKVLQYDGGRLKKMDATIAELYPAEQNDGTYYPFYYIYNSWDEDKKYPVLYSEDELVVRNGNKPSKMAKGGEMTDGDESERKAEAVKTAVEIASMAYNNGVIASDMSFEDFTRTIMDISNKSYSRVDLRLAYESMKSAKYAKGGYMAKDENYEYVNTFKRFDSNVPVPQEDFEKLVDAYHKQLSGDKLAVSKYKVLKLQMGNYLGHKTVEEMEEYIEKTHNAHKMAKGGYIAKRNIKLIIIKNPNKKGSKSFLQIDKKDFLDGLHMEKGGKIDKNYYTYINRRDVNQVVYTEKGQTKVENKPLNGFWVSNEALNKAGRNFEKSFKKDDVVYNKDTDTVGIVRSDSYNDGTTNTDSDGVVNTDLLQKYNTLTFGLAQIANSTRKEIIDRKLLDAEDLPYEQKKNKFFNPTVVRKSTSIGWTADTYTQEKHLGYDWKISTYKSGLYLKSIAQGGKDEKGIWSFMLYQDPRVVLITADGKRVTEKLVSAQQAKALLEFQEMFNDGSLKQKIENQNKMADGGSIGFDALSKKVASRYAGKNVKAKYQGEYGKTYDKAEAKEVGDKVAAKVYRMQQGKMAMGGKMQGYNDRLDESLSERNDKISKMNATFKARRDESKGENKSMGKRAYSSVNTMDKMAMGGELQKGIRTEMKEHGMSRAEATKTANDHLKEDSKYYTKMAKIGLKDGGKIELPHQLDRYFTKPSGTIEVEMSKLIPIRARKSGIENAEVYMKKAYDGEMSKRKPIEIYKTRNKKYRVNDGNSTYAVAKKNGWETIYATVVSNPNVTKRAEKSTFTIAKEIRKVGESWADAVKRVKENRK